MYYLPIWVSLVKKGGNFPQNQKKYYKKNYKMLDHAVEALM